MFIKFDKSETGLSAKEKAARKKLSEQEESEKADFARMVSEKKNGLAKPPADSHCPDGKAGNKDRDAGGKKELAATIPTPGDKEDRKKHTFTTQTLGEEGGKDQTFTTQRLGEEGGKDQTFTTQALAEEGGAGAVSAVGNPTRVMVSQLLDDETDEDEEDDVTVNPPKPGTTMTTMAMGEEGGKNNGRE